MFLESNIKINSKNFSVIDAIEYITLADSFVKDNKIGNGHGEAKLYIGNVSANNRIENFFEGFKNVNCFFLKKDFITFLMDAKSEYFNPQQEYNKKDTMIDRYINLYNSVEKLDNGFLNFKLYRVNVAPPRIYVNSDSPYYDFMRKIGLPNISYLSILKLKDINGKILFYFRIFIDYKPNIIGYIMPEEREEENKINNNASISDKEKQTIIRARIGQGEYRNKLLLECPFCPFTMVNDERLLIASHIKPWAKSNDKEKIDPKNGFMLTPTYDRLFDQGFITFSNDKRLIVSPWISPMNQKRLNIYTDMKLQYLPMDEKREEYLEYHREKIFKA